MLYQERKIGDSLFVQQNTLKMYNLFRISLAVSSVYLYMICVCKTMRTRSKTDTPSRYGVSPLQGGDIFPVALLIVTHFGYFVFVMPDLKHSLIIVVDPCTKHARAVVVLNDRVPSLDNVTIRVSDHNALDPNHTALAFSGHHPSVSC